MDPSTSARSSRLRCIVRRLGAVTWAVVAVALVVSWASTGFRAGASPPTIAVALVSVFFLLLIVRTVLAAVLGDGRRGPRIAFVVALALWMAGSLTVNSGDGLAQEAFPSVAEAFFIPSYVLLVAAVLIDSPPTWVDGLGEGRGLQAVRQWLSTVVLVGGVASLAGLLLTSPMAGDIGIHGVWFVVALYPVLVSLCLAALLVTQVGMQSRPASRDVQAMIVGFLLLAGADFGTTVASAADGGYSADRLYEALYAGGFALVTAGLCRAHADLARSGGSGRGSTAVQLVAAATALAALALKPAGTDQWYVLVPSVLVLVAVGVLLALALHQARQATEARRLSLTDDLTGLANRRAVLAELDAALAAAAPVSLMLLDMDGFKDVNDSLGHSAGDQLLVVLARRLRTMVPATGGVAARLGGDEFAVVGTQTSEVVLVDLARTLRAGLAEPIVIDGVEVSLRSSVGIAVRQDGDAAASDLLRRADIAMYEAKNSRTDVLLYDPARDGYTRERLVLAEELRHGIAAGELALWYQPQVDAHGGVVGAEALVRWRHPTRGLLTPIHFLNEARRSGLMAVLTESVIAQVVAQAAAWHRDGLSLRLSFNCAPAELLGTSLMDQLYSSVEAAALPPESILVEVTEDSFVSEPERAREVLVEMRRHRVQAAIDDYGTGFSSLSYLRDLPVHELKIDRSFVQTLVSDRRNSVIIESTCRMAHAMDLRVVAEGVEDAATAARLVHIGVDLLQGFVVARPMPGADLAAWVRQRRAAPVAAGL